LGRHFLHAAKLKIILPGAQEPQVFEAGLPEELERALEELRNKK
jgi:23S rRNA pseudouridine1911/1915/1917 synthase